MNRPDRTSSLAAKAASLLRVRWFARAPIMLYRARLGALFGSRLLLLEHVGRRTGVVRRVVLEVVARPAPGRYVVASGFGERAQWYRNVRAHPQVRITVGSGRPRAATARILSSADSAAALADYSAKHPRAWSALRPVFEATLGARIGLSGTDLPMVAFDLAQPGPPLTAAIDIAAPPSAVWAVVSDVRRTGEWSPECRRVVRLGRLLLGLNRRDRVRWVSLSRVVTLNPGQKIAWRVLTNGSVWTYRLEPTAHGTRLIETRETPDGVKGFARWFIERYLGGQTAHDDELQTGMVAGLTRIKHIVECG